MMIAEGFTCQRYGFNVGADKFSLLTIENGKTSIMRLSEWTLISQSQKSHSDRLLGNKIEFDGKKILIWHLKISFSVVDYILVLKKRVLHSALCFLKTVIFQQPSRKSALLNRSLQHSLMKYIRWDNCMILPGVLQQDCCRFLAEPSRLCLWAFGFFTVLSLQNLFLSCSLT